MSDYDVRAELLKFKQRGITKIRYNNAADPLVCDSCKRWGAPTILVDIDEALEKMPIPHDCTGELGCRCFVTAVVDVSDSSRSGPGFDEREAAKRKAREEAEQESEEAQGESGIGGLIKRLFGR